MKQEVGEGDADDKPKRPCDQSCDHEEEQQPLMKSNNNYQFCWNLQTTAHWQTNHSSEKYEGRPKHFAELQAVVALSATSRLLAQTDDCSDACDSPPCRPWLETATSAPSADTEGENMSGGHTIIQSCIFIMFISPSGVWLLCPLLIMLSNVLNVCHSFFYAYHCLLSTDF